jgi:hypothetical protein
MLDKVSFWGSFSPPEIKTDPPGGTSAIFVCDDGMQLISKREREERMDFYANHNIGWVARPGHSSAPDGFKRAGKFKKASKYVSCQFQVLQNVHTS